MKEKLIYIDGMHFLASDGADTHLTALLVSSALFVGDSGAEKPRRLLTCREREEGGRHGVFIQLSA